MAAGQADPPEGAPPADVPCSRSPLAVPRVRGFRLGMTLKEVAAAYPGLKSAPEDFETTQAWLIPTAGQPVGDPRLEGVSGVFLAFLRDKLYSVEVHYGGKNPWRGMGEFTSAVSGAMGLTKPWAEEGEVWSLSCGGFRLVATGPEYAPTLYLIDLQAEKILTGLRGKQD